MPVKIDEIEKIVLLLLSKLRESKGNEIELNSDYYWNIKIDEIYNPYAEPKQLTMGQLSEDLEQLCRLEIIDNAVPYDLKRVASILLALSVENQTAF